MEAKKKEIEERTYKLRCIFLLKLSNCMCVQVLYVNLMQACIVLLPFIQYSFFISSCISLFPMIHGLKRQKDISTFSSVVTSKNSTQTQAQTQGRFVACCESLGQVCLIHTISSIFQTFYRSHYSYLYKRKLS